MTNTDNSTASEIVYAYSDGAAKGNPGPGGYGVVLKFHDDIRELSDGFKKTTNNRMELMGAIVALEALKGGMKVVLTSDSRYVVDAMNKKWLEGWRRNGWKRKDNKPVANVDLFQRLYSVIQRHTSVEFVWIRGHSGHAENARCDELASNAAKQDNLPPDEGYGHIETSGNDEPTHSSDSRKNSTEASSAISTEQESSSPLTHLDEDGKANMVDIGEKSVTKRTALAYGRVALPTYILDLITSGGMPKGDVIAAARLAGIMAAKRTPDIIPLCHHVPLDKVTVSIGVSSDRKGLDIEAWVCAHWKTGVEMEALTAVSVAALTIYDMCKSADKGIRIESIHLIEKKGGKSGDYRSP